MSSRAVVPAGPVIAKPRALTHAPASLLQRKCECGSSAGFENDCEECKKKKLQRRATSPGPSTAPPIVHDVLRSSGQPLDASTRAFFEPRFGHDFSRVRVHLDTQAQESARAVHAQAYTVGHDLIFGPGRFAPDTIPGRQLLAHELTHVVQQSRGGPAPVQRKLEVGSANDSLEKDADRIAEEMTSDRSVMGSRPVPPASNGAGMRVQRVADSSVSESRASNTGTVPVNTGLIVEDGARELGSGQMRKTEFLDGLRDSVCATADSELKSVGRTAQGCPFIERWIAKLRGHDSQYIERAIRKYAHRSNASTAREYFAAVGEQVRQGVRRWASTGDVSGVPPELMSEMGGGGIPGAIGGAVSGALGAIGNAFAGIGKLFTKAGPGGAREGNAATVNAQLGAGATLERGVRTRMEAAFGHDFSGVRVHADSRASSLAAGLNARAFAIGNQVAFAAGEYQPGTLIGDALIAHELAHVLQQRNASSPATASSTAGAGYAVLEEDADRSAVEAVASMWQGGKKWLAEVGPQAMPRLRSGLRLQRCGGRDRKLDVSAWTEKQQKDFISKNFPAKDQSFAAKILKDMLDSGEMKFFDEESLKAEIAKRLETVQLLRKTQEPYGVAFDYPENAPQCFPKGAPKQGQINKAARAYWGPVQFSETYYFELTELGKNNAYKALTLLFTPQSNICDKTLIHCDFLASVIHFRAFADQIGVEEFNRRVKNGDIEMRLAWNGFKDLEDVGWFHSKKSISIREVRPKNENDLVIGDQVLFWNHRAYDLINAGVHHEWRLENAFLIDRRGKVDYFEGHGSGTHTVHTMLIKLASEYNKIYEDWKKVRDQTKSKDARTAAAANADMVTRFPNIKPVMGKWNIVGPGWGRFFNEEFRPLSLTNPEKEPDLLGLHDPQNPSRMYCIKRPSEAPGDSC